jgi:hypothetical protein
MAKDVSPLEQAAARRDLARRARRVGQALTLDADRARLLQYAEELEEQEVRLESEGGGRPGTRPAPVAQQQVQEQQQESSDAPDSPPAKPKSD